MRSSELNLKAKQQGMTLIEVMVALAVFGYAAVTLVTASSANLNSHSRIKQKTLAGWVAQNQLTEFLINHKPGKQAKTSKKGEAEMAGVTFYYKIKVEDSGNQWLNQVKVDVSTDKAGKYVISSVNGFLEKP